MSTNILNTIFSKYQKQEKNKYLYIKIEKLYKYKNIWENKNIFYMTKTLISDYQKSLYYSDTNINYQKNLNFLHIAELLEEKFRFFHKRTSIMKWLEKKIQQRTKPSQNERIRSFDEYQSVKIITIHKSKGLEYPIVWIPFGINFTQSITPIYHNEKNFKTFFDIKYSSKSLENSDKERLAEDIRFLYVAITRSILHCSIGIACLKKKTKKNTNNSDIHLSALGYIIQYNISMNYEHLLIKLNKLKKRNIIEIKNNTINNKLVIEKKIDCYLIPKPKFLNKKIENTEKITSFTQLNQENKSLIHNNNEIILESFSIEQASKNKNLSIHSFPTGKKSGILIHYIMKSLNFSNKKTLNWFIEILDKYSFSQKWSSILMSWIYDIINVPININNQKITLSKLKKESYIQELEFFLPIKNTLYSEKFNKVIQNFDSISLFAPKIFFNPVSGVLKGFIDLIFIWKNKYYILDYKTNWLGKNNNFYTDEYIKNEIIKKRYDLQYQIYSIAIHQYLKNIIKNYNYKTHFGGILYMFLRGIKNKKNNGIFYILPDYSLIEKLIILIS